MFRSFAILILVVLLTCCAFSSAPHPEQSTTDDQSAPAQAPSPRQAVAISTTTAQRLTPSAHTNSLATSTPHPPAAITPTSERDALYARIPQHFTDFTLPRDRSTCTQPDPSSTTPLRSGHLSLATVKNTRYVSSETFQEIQLHNGYSIDPTVAAGFVTPPAQNDVGTLLIEPVFRGDIDHDGREDAVVMLKTRGGGTGAWRELAVLLNHQPEPENIAVIYFSDRDFIKEVTITNGDITITAMIHQTGDGVCCPSLTIQKTFRLCQGNMVEVSHRDPVPRMTPVSEQHPGMLMYAKPHLRGLRLK